MRNSNLHINQDLLVKYLTGEIDQEEALKVETWLEGSPLNRKQLEELKTVWEKVGEIPFEKVDSEAAWKKLKNRMAQKEVAVQDDKIRELVTERKDNWKIILRIAAVFVLAVSLLTIYFSRYSDKDVPHLAFVSDQSVRKGTLPDGSFFTLRENSVLEFPEAFKGDIREVTLKGEAFFDVKRNPEKPFVIKADEVFVKVLGTSFNVKAYSSDDEIEVAVKTGKVMMGPAEGSKEGLILEAGTKGIFEKRSGTFRKSLIDEDPSKSAPARMLVFEDKEMTQVIETLEKSYNVDIRMSDKAIGHCKLTVTFDDAPISSVLAIIAATLELKVEDKDDYILLKGEGCKRQVKNNN